MCCIKCSKKDTLAIIGNGFDLAHGYKTDYGSFSQSSDDFALREFKKFCDEASIKTWYDFENNINILTEKFFMQSYSEDGDYDVNRDKTTHLREIFTRIQDLLAEYLQNEINKKTLVKISSIAKYLDFKSVAINFNYTDTVEKYTDNIFYVHGSLRENDILLGYDYRNEACLAQFDDMCWGKSLCREALAFRRMLHNDLGLSTNNSRYNELCSSLEIYQSCESSGRGIDDHPESYIPNYAFVNDFIKNYREEKDIPDINYGDIKNIVVIGHGIEADRVYLDRIIRKCSNLKKIIIFRYSNESDDEFNKKVGFLQKYSTRIKTVFY